MDKKQLQPLKPQNKNDVERAQHLVSLGYPAIKPVAWEMLRWLRTYRALEPDYSPVAAVFLTFFIANGATAAEEIEKALRIRGDSHLKYVIVTHVLPEWPAIAVALVKEPLGTLVCNSDMPETRLMAIRLLAAHHLSDKGWLKGWLRFITERLESNLTQARQIEETYFGIKE